MNMQTGTLQELINFCESRKLGDLATGLKQELRQMRKSGSASLKGSSASQKKLAKDKDQEQPDAQDTQKRTLKLIRDAIRKDEKKRNKE